MEAMRLSKNFTLAEMTKSHTALRCGVPNNPNEAEIAALEYLCLTVLQPIRDHFGLPVRVNSAFRSKYLNSLVGSTNTSQHILGQAADIEIIGLDNYELALWISENLDFDQLVLEYYETGEPNAGWVHVSIKEVVPNRLECLTINKNATRKGILNGR